MATQVTQQYNSDFNISVTERDGKVTKVTTWETNLSGSTRVVEYHS